MAAKTALITGVAGQDGSYLAELLLNKGYRVCGLVRRPGELAPQIEHLRGRLQLWKGDLADQESLEVVLEQVRPDEVYNLAAASFVPLSWQKPVSTADVTALGVTRLLEAVRQVCPTARVFQAGSSEMFGKAVTAPQNELTPFRPRTPYGSAKVYGYHLAVNYRDHHGLFACNGILYNHESPRRGLDFVTRKITHGVARVKLGLAGELRLGNLQARRDWSFAGDVVRAMWLALQQDEPDDYVLGSGRLHTVEEFVQTACAHAGVDWRRYVVVDPQFFRPEDTVLVADPLKARRRLDWQSEVGFTELVRRMVEHDLAMLGAERKAA